MPKFERSAEVLPLLVVGALALLALTLWLWRASKIETGTLHRLSLTEAPIAPKRAKPSGPPAAPKLEVPALPLEGLLSSWREEDGAAVLIRPGGSRLRLTIEPKVQRALERRLERSRVPYAAVVMLDPRTGAVLAMAEKREDGSAIGRAHGIGRANMPAASVFKIVTAAALLEAGVDPELERCYHGGSRGIEAHHLKADRRDASCATLREAMARSINLIFARLATEHLTAGDLAAAAEDLRFGRQLPFDCALEPSRLAIDAGALALGRAAAGFGDAMMSPMHAAMLAATVANGGVMMRPHVVDADSLQTGLRREPEVIGRAMPAARAATLAELMADTVRAGSATRQFQPWPASLAGVQVAGKTGTIDRRLDGDDQGEFAGYTWFVGFAPADAPQVAIAAVAVNERGWWLRGPALARAALVSWLEAHPEIVGGPPVEPASAPAAPAAPTAAATPPRRAGVDVRVTGAAPQVGGAKAGVVIGAKAGVVIGGKPAVALGAAARPSAGADQGAEDEAGGESGDESGDDGGGDAAHADDDRG